LFTKCKDIVNNSQFTAPIKFDELFYNNIGADSWRQCGDPEMPTGEGSCFYLKVKDTCVARFILHLTTDFASDSAIFIAASVLAAYFVLSVNIMGDLIQIIIMLIQNCPTDARILRFFFGKT
jgi:hypothetical protein